MEKRIAVRAIIIDTEMNTPILSVRGGAFYKIPGGKIEEGEDLDTALRREIREETGCEIEVIDKVGEFNFFMQDKNKINHSVCYLARLIGDRGEPNFDAKELERQFQLIWLNLNKAIETFETCILKTENPVERAIHNRDLNFLKQAKSLIEMREIS